MKLHVIDHLDKSSFTLKSKPGDTITSLKSEIITVSGLPSELQCLIFEDCELENLKGDGTENCLTDFDITSGSTIMLHHKYSDKKWHENGDYCNVNTGGGMQSIWVPKNTPLWSITPLSGLDKKVWFHPGRGHPINWHELKTHARSDREIKTLQAKVAQLENIIKEYESEEKREHKRARREH